MNLSRTKATSGWVKELGLHKLKPFYSTKNGEAFHADSLDCMRRIPAESVDLVFTSPPFALTRKKEYGNEPVDRYLEWFMPFCAEIRRILKPEGSFVLDIGGAWIPGAPVRSMYHFEVAVFLSKMFHVAQDFYWYNPSKLPTPAEWVTVRRIRVKDAVNTVWWFSRDPNPRADNRNVLRPYSESMKTLLKQGYRAKKRPSGHDISTKFSVDNGGAIPPNLLTIANTESNSAYLRNCRRFGIKPHPARFPAQLVDFFLRLLDVPPDGVVLDPFAGSNVTGRVAEDHSLRWLSFDTQLEYLRGSMLRFLDSQGMADPATQVVLSGSIPPTRSKRNARNQVP